jgi:TRAP-type C4-dicarboxylate transport system substrate-binding protein
MRRALAAGVGIAVAWAAPARAEQVLRLGTVAPEGSVYMQDLEGIALDVERLSEGALKLKWIAGGALGDDREMGELVLAGKLDGGGLTDVGLSAIVPQMVVWGLPGLFQDVSEVDYIQTSLRKRWDELFEASGVVLLAWGDIGFLHVYSQEAIRTVDDLKRHNLWLWKGDTAGIWAMSELGVQGTVTTLAEMAEQVKSGAITTFQFPAMAMFAWQLHTYPRYISELRYRYMTGALVVDKAVFQSLPKDQQRVLRSVGRKWERKILKLWRAENGKAIAVLKKQGVKWVDASDAAVDGWFAATQVLQPRFAKQFGVEDLLGEITDGLGRFRDARRAR